MSIKTLCGIAVMGLVLLVATGTLAGAETDGNNWDGNALLRSCTQALRVMERSVQTLSVMQAMEAGKCPGQLHGILQLNAVYGSTLLPTQRPGATAQVTFPSMPHAWCCLAQQRCWVARGSAIKSRIVDISPLIGSGSHSCCEGQPPMRDLARLRLGLLRMIEESYPMNSFPTPYSACKHKGLTYSVGVIRNKLGAEFGECPLVRCKQCHTTYFTDLPFTTWYHCGEVERGITFTDDPAAIDYSIKLDYESKTIRNVKVYTVYLASRSNAQV